MRIPLSGALALALLSFSCGDDGDGGGGADAGDGVDALPAPDARPRTTSCGLLLTYRSAAQRAGAPVVFSTPDGTVLGTEVTDVDGRASRNDCQPGTLVTFDLAATAGGGLGGTRLVEAVTVAGVNPGDTVVYPRSELASFEATVPVNVSADTAGIAHDSSTVTVGRACGTFGSAVGTSRDLDISAPCLGTDQTTDVAAMLFSQNELVGFASATDIPVAFGEVTSPVDLPGFSNVSADQDVALTVSNAGPAELVFLSLDQGRDLNSFLQWTAAPPPQDGSYGWSFDALPTSFGDYMVAEGRVLNSSPNGSVSDRLLSTRSAPSTSAAIDMNEALPTMRGASLSLDDGNALLLWQADGSQAEADGGFARIQLQSPAVFGSWTVVFPAVEDSSYLITAIPKSLGLTSSDLRLIELGFFEFDWADYQSVITTGADTIEGPRTSVRDTVRRISRWAILDN
jgi:hypothetical protein